MVIWDTNILALYFGGRLDGDDRLRMDGMVSELSRKREPIGIPAQVWAEFLHAASLNALNQSDAILKSSAFRFLPYDMRATVENAEIARTGMAARKSQKGKIRERQAVKVDWQILAIAKVHNARILLTNDVDMAKEAARLGIKCQCISDLPIPEELRQHNLTLMQGHADTESPSVSPP